MYRFTIVVCLIFPVLFASLALAGIPKLINYQGMLTESDGYTPVADGTYNINFKIYNASSGGDKRWEETQTDVAVTNGLFNVILGGATVGGIDLDFSEEYWLDVTVEGEQMGERLRFTSVGYAYRARIADSATVAVSAPTGGGWTDDGSVVRLAWAKDSVGIGTTAPEFKLDVHSSGTAIRGRTSGGPFNNGVYGRATSNGFGVLGTSSSGHGVHGASTSGYAGYFDGPKNYFSGKVGIGTTAPLTTAHVRGSSLSLLSGELWYDEFILEDADAILGLYSGTTGPAGSAITFGEVSGGALADKWAIIRETSGGGKGLRITYGTGKDQFVNPTMMYLDSLGNVGIGTRTPGAKLGVNGDLKVTGAYKGDISSSSGSDGAPFPRPAYDSGWQTINPGETIELTHNIGGDVDNYVVDLQFWRSTYGIHTINYGGNTWSMLEDMFFQGAWYKFLTTSIIKIFRSIDDWDIHKVRVRIWVYE
jgi:hypothetical protein